MNQAQARNVFELRPFDIPLIMLLLMAGTRPNRNCRC